MEESASAAAEGKEGCKSSKSRVRDAILEASEGLPSSPRLPSTAARVAESSRTDEFPCEEGPDELAGSSSPSNDVVEKNVKGLCTGAEDAALMLPTTALKAGAEADADLVFMNDPGLPGTL
jgi:hypothetical protein